VKIEQNHVAVVTGAASGIGCALAKELARRGCHLAICDVSDDVEKTAEAVRELGRDVLVQHVDVSDKRAMQAFAASVQDELGGADILVNNAGVNLTGEFETCTLEDWEWLMGVNLWGVIYGCHMFLPQLKAGPAGHIVNLSSVFGMVGIPSQSAYCASKFAVRGLTETLHIELMDSPIGVTSVHPGAVATNITRAARFRGEADDPDKQRVIHKIIGRGMQPARAAEHIANAIERDQPRLLLGSDAKYLDRMARLAPVWYRGLVKKFGDRQRVKSAG
jgi:NAD(P)-dependent dehydrogenase (short-subunit alcohol dehydrogenase family)